MTDDRDRRGPPPDTAEAARRLRAKLAARAGAHPHGVPVQRMTPAGGIPSVVERARAGLSHVEHARVTPRAVSIPPVPQREYDWEDGPAPGPDAPAEQFEGFDTGVIALQLQEAARDGASLVEPVAKLYARSHRQTEATVTLGKLVTEIMATNAERERDDKARDERERENRRKGRQALYIALIATVVPTLVAIAALIAALHGAPAPTIETHLPASSQESR